MPVAHASVDSVCVYKRDVSACCTCSVYYMPLVHAQELLERCECLLHKRLLHAVQQAIGEM